MKPTAQQALDTARGGRLHKNVRHRDGSARDIFVYQLPMRHLERFVELALAGDDQARLELCIGRSPEWDKKYRRARAADNIVLEDQEALLALADEINFPPALSRIERAKNTITRLEPPLRRLYALQAEMLRKPMEEMARQLTAALAPSSPPASPSSGAPTPNSGTTGASSNLNTPSTSSTPRAAPPPSPPSTAPTTPSTPLSAPHSEPARPPMP